MESIALLLTYKSANGAKTVPLANICNRTLVEAACCEAILAAEKQANEAALRDEGLGTIEFASARRLGDILAVFIPALNPPEAKQRSKGRQHEDSPDHSH